MGTVDDPSSADTTSDVPAGRRLVLDERFVEALSAGQLQAYLDAVTSAASGQHADVDELAGTLAADLQRLQLPMPSIQVKMLAEQLFGVQDARLEIVTTGGQVLAEHGGAAGTPQRSGSAADPDHPDRPFGT